MSSTGTLYERREKFVHLNTANVRSTVRDGPTLLKKIVINDPSTTVLTVYNNGEYNGQVVAAIDCNLSRTLIYDILLPSGLAISGTNTAGYSATVIYE